jgi:hypothetical protein
VARLLLVASFLTAIGLGALAIAGAPGLAAASGDRWIWSGPPTASGNNPAFYDLRRHAPSLVVPSHVDVVWTISADSTRMWTARPTQGGGGFRSPIPLIYDAGGDRLLGVEFDLEPADTCCTVIGLFRPTVFHLDVPFGWAPIPARGPAMPYRDQASVTFDSRRNRLLVCGGFSGLAHQLSSEVDAFDLASDSASWSSFDVSAPALPIQNGSAVYDSLADRVIVYAGWDTNGVKSNDVYSLDLGAPTGWTAWTPPTPVSTLGTPNFPPKLLLDPARHRLLYVTAMRETYSPGVPPYGIQPDSLVAWQLDLVTHAGWTVISCVGRSADVNGATCTYDPERNRLDVYGGESRSDLYELVLDGVSPWVCVQKSNRLPRVSDNDPVMLDRRRGQVIVLANGGNDAWIMHRGATDTWEECRPLGDTPPGHSFAIAAFDSTSGKGYLYGGGIDEDEFGDLWQFSIDDSNRVTWQRLFLDGPIPEPRYGAGAVYDPLRRRLVMFGGYAGRALGDTWELSLVGTPRWRRLPDRGTPPSARFLPCAVYDSRRDGMIVYGGNYGALQNRLLLDDTSILSFADGDTWEPLTAFGRAPAPRYGAGAAYDPIRDRMLVFWGAAYNGGRIDCDELDLADGPTWRDFSPTGLSLIGRGFFNAIYDPDRDQAVLFGGEEAPAFTGPVVFPQTLAADFSANPVTSPPTLHGPPLALLGFVPNPTRDAESVAFDLPVDADVRARLYDARGRLVRDLGPKRYVAGRHLLLWDGKDKDGIVPPSGMYFVRLSTLGKDFSGKFVLVK